MRSDSTLKVLVFADMRNPHAAEWVRGLKEAGLSVLALSSELLDVGAPEALSFTEPISILRKHLVHSGLNQVIRRRLRNGSAIVSAVSSERSAVDRYNKAQIAESMLLPIRYPWRARALSQAIRTFRPDIVHALRIPYEGLSALAAVHSVPVVISSWGQDFELQAAGDPLLRKMMTVLLPRASGFMFDAEADLGAARDIGLRPFVPALHVAGNFGVETSLFYPSQRSGTIQVTYPRGLRDYVAHERFLELVLAFQNRKEVKFVGVGLADDQQAREVLALVGASSLRLTPPLPRSEFADILRHSHIVISPSRSDGTPNSVLEAVSVGAYVLAGNIPSLRALSQDQPKIRLLDVESPEDWRAAMTTVLTELVLDSKQSTCTAALPSPYVRDQNMHRVPSFYGVVIEGPRGI